MSNNNINFATKLVVIGTLLVVMAMGVSAKPACLIYDEFDGSSVNASIWNELGDEITVGDGQLNMTGDGSFYRDSVLDSIQDFTINATNLTVKVRYKVSAQPTTYGAFPQVVSCGGQGTNDCTSIGGSNGVDLFVVNDWRFGVDGATQNGGSDYGTFLDDTWYNSTLYLSTSATHHIIDDGATEVAGSATALTLVNVSLISGQESDKQMQWDWVKVWYGDDSDCEVVSSVTILPSFSNNATNATNPAVNDDVNISIQIDDDVGISGYIFSKYNESSSSWLNDSWVEIAGSPTSYNASVVKTMPDWAFYNYTWYANDTSNSFNNSDIFSLDIQQDLSITQSSYNFSSGENEENQTAWQTDLTVRVETEDRTPTIKFDTNLASYCAIDNQDNNFSEMVTAGGYECAEGLSTSHTCTYGANLDYGNNDLFLACGVNETTPDNWVKNFTSGALPVDISFIPQISGYLKDANDNLVSNGTVIACYTSGLADGGALACNYTQTDVTTGYYNFSRFDNEGIYAVMGLNLNNYSAGTDAELMNITQ